MTKIKYTNRKFYNKWVYKVSLLIPGISVMRINSIEKLVDFDKEAYPEGNGYRQSSLIKAHNNKLPITKLARILNSYDKDAYAKRIESNRIDIYTNDKTVCDSIDKDLSDKVAYISIPDNNQLDILNTGLIPVQKLPHGIYKYKVYLLPHKFKNDVPNKNKYLAWLDQQNPKILISEKVKKWFIDTNWNWDRRYIYVQDEHTLLLLKLRASEAMGRVYEYSTVDK
jgi:hypothetical protein